MKSKITIPKYCRGLRKRLQRLERIAGKRLPASAQKDIDAAEKVISELEEIGDRLERAVKK